MSLRLGHDGRAALSQIAQLRGISEAEAARQAIAETAARDRRRRDLAAEAREMMGDPDYVAEALEVAALMEHLRGPR
jgi:hypothetical protein